MTTPYIGNEPVSPFPHGVTLTINRRQVDRYGDWQVISTHQIPGCSVSPAGSSEDVARGERDTLSVTMKVHAPFGADVQSSDTVTLPDGTLWEVDGDTTSYASPFTGWAPGLDFMITRTTG